MRTVLMRLAAVFIVAASPACRDDGYQWAFAVNTDGSVKPAEHCRESLAAAIGDSDLKSEHATTPNIFLVASALEPYRIHAFETRRDCDNALAALVSARKQ